MMKNTCYPFLCGKVRSSSFPSPFILLSIIFWNYKMSGNPSHAKCWLLLLGFPPFFLLLTFCWGLAVSILVFTLSLSRFLPALHAYLLPSRLLAGWLADWREIHPCGRLISLPTSLFVCCELYPYLLLPLVFLDILDIIQKGSKHRSDMVWYDMWVRLAELWRQSFPPRNCPSSLPTLLCHFPSSIR